MVLQRLDTFKWLYDPTQLHHKLQPHTVVLFYQLNTSILICKVYCWEEMAAVFCLSDGRARSSNIIWTRSALNRRSISSTESDSGRQASCQRADGFSFHPSTWPSPPETHSTSAVMCKMMSEICKYKMKCDYRPDNFNLCSKIGIFIHKVHFLGKDKFD